MKPIHAHHPGSAPLSDNLVQDITKMMHRRGKDYMPRTRHLNPDGTAMYTNRLFLETSQYLNQHAHNPVNWYPWGKEAFEKAKTENLPILVSIGYSTCHWCHVMEEESFEDPEIAGYLNRHYVAVKVDREERPDVDSIYMKAVQAMGIHGGWPLNVVLTPDLKPFFGGTYFPPRDGERGVMSGFLSILKKIRQAFDEKRQYIEDTALAVTRHIQKSSVTDREGDLPDQAIFSDILVSLKGAFDPQNGGIKGAPKFPSSLPVSLLFKIYMRTGNPEAKEMALTTLKKMACGGMYDHVGGGFHRYSVDDKWLVPHFEKMLYDNALLAEDYIQAYQLTKEPFYQKTAGEILDYVLRDMTAQSGGFFSATDADSKNDDNEYEEGFYFTWTPSELDNILGKDLSTLVRKVYGVTETGNFEGRSIFFLEDELAVFAARHHTDLTELHRDLERAKTLLLTTRNKRQLPIRDEKIIASWNGLMISAFAKGAVALQNDRYLKAARKAALFVLDHMFVNNRLHRCHKDGMVKTAGFLEDYTFMTRALIDLYEIDRDSVWLEKAKTLETITHELFKDETRGGFFMTATESDPLIAREKTGSDNAIPSGNSIALMNLLRLDAFFPDAGYVKTAEHLMKAFSKQISFNPIAFSTMLQGVFLYIYLDKIRHQ